jgi:hypothetical protein
VRISSVLRYLVVWRFGEQIPWRCFDVYHASYHVLLVVLSGVDEPWGSGARRNADG